MPSSAPCYIQVPAYVKQASISQLREELRAFGLNSRSKLASLGGEPEAGFEQAFASLAFAYLREKAPKLLDYLVGFQLVERSDDMKKAFGVFGFRPGKLWLYVPMVFLKGDLKGHELLYVKDKDAFVPLTEEWVNDLLSRDEHVLGESHAQQDYQRSAMQPDLRAMRFPPMSGKYASAQVEEWLEPAMPAIAALMVDPDRLLAKHEKTASAVDLRAPLSQNFDMLKTAFQLYQRFPAIKQGFDRFYGPDFFRKTAEQMRTKVAGHETSLLRNLRAPQKEASLEIITSDLLGLPLETSSRLSDAEKTTLATTGMLVRDKRAEEETTKAYHTDKVSGSYMNPSETGVFETLVSPAKFRKILCIHNPHAPGGQFTGITAVAMDEGAKDRAHDNFAAAELWIKEPYGDEKQYKDWFEDQSSADLSVDSSYVAVGPNGQGSCVITIRKSLGEDRYEVSADDWCNRPRDLPRVGREERGTQSHVYPELMSINRRKGTSMRSVGGELFVPDEFKFIKVKRSWEERQADEDKERLTPIKPGNLIDAQFHLQFNESEDGTEKKARLKVWSDGNEVYLQTGNVGKRFSKTAAFIELMTNVGLREKAAREMLREADRVAGNAKTYLLVAPVEKRAFGFGQGGTLTDSGPFAPAIPDPQMMSADYPAGGMMFEQQLEALPVEGMQPYGQEPSIEELLQQGQENPLQVAQQAAQSGQKEVFDTAMFGGLLKSVRRENLVDRHLGDLMKAVDKLGRIYLCSLWHREEFEDRYGRDKMPEIEDAIRNAFDAAGEVTLTLKQKEVNPRLDFPSDTESIDAIANMN